MFAAGGSAVVVDLRAAVGGVADERGPVSEGVADRLLDRVKLAVSRQPIIRAALSQKRKVFETMNRAICYCTLANHADASMTGIVSFS